MQKKQAEKNAACTVNSAEGVWVEKLKKLPHLPGEQIRKCGMHNRLSRRSPSWRIREKKGSELNPRAREASTTYWQHHRRRTKPRYATLSNRHHFFESKSISYPAFSLSFSLSLFLPAGQGERKQYAGTSTQTRMPHLPGEQIRQVKMIPCSMWRQRAEETSREECSLHSQLSRRSLSWRTREDATFCQKNR